MNAAAKDRRAKAYAMVTAKKPDGRGAAVRLDADLVVRAKYLAARKGAPLSEYLSGLLRPLIEQEFKKVGRELMEEGGEK
jgi:hypothetical protein